MGSVDLEALAAQLNVEQESTQQELDLGELQRTLAVTLNSTEPAEIRLQLTTFEQWKKDPTAGARPIRRHDDL